MKSNHLFILGLIILIIPNIFWLFLGENSFINIHDNLDSEFVYLKHIINSNNILGFDLNGKIDGVMNGLNRSAFRSGFNVTVLLFYLFPPVVAYVLNHLLVHLVGYIGMYLLLKKYFTNDSKILTFSISLMFGFLSYYHVQYGISISGQPLLLLAFLNLLRQEKSKWNWVIISLFPFFAFSPVTVPFYIPVLIAIGFSDYYKTKTIPKNFLLGLLMFTSLSLLIEFNLIYSMFISNFQSHRLEWDKFVIAGVPTFRSSFDLFWIAMKNTQYHAGLLKTYPVIIALILSIGFKIKFQRKDVWLITLILLIALWTPFCSILIYNFGHDFTLLRTFTIERFFFLSPLLWLLLLASILTKFNTSSLIQKGSMSLLLLFMFIPIIKRGELMDNVRLLLKPTSKISYSQYFQNKTFTEVKSYLDNQEVSEYNVICIGFNPGVAQFNGMNTLDSYQNNYALSYKHQFKEVIQNELNENKEIREYFDSWGSRCYSFSSAIGKNFAFFQYYYDNPIPEPKYNWLKFKEMKGKYILSSCRFEKNNQPDLALIKVFKCNNLNREIFIYKAS